MSLIIHAENLYESGRECKKEVKLVETMLAKGSVQLHKKFELKLAKLKKLMERREITEETRQWLELRKNVAQQQGKKSHLYLHKMTWEIVLE